MELRDVALHMLQHLAPFQPQIASKTPRYIFYYFNPYSQKIFGGATVEIAWELKESFSPLVVRKPKEIVLEVKPRKSSHKITYLTVPLLLTPGIAYANDGRSTFFKIYDTVMTLFDQGVVLVIVFAGASWMLGHRSKAIELLIACCCGYLLAAHAVEIRDFLKSIKS